MKKRSFISRILILLLAFSFVAPAFSDSTTPEPYHDNEFPQFLKDVRRFEIVTLGALPFVCIQTTLGYSTYQYVNHNCSGDYFPNPFAASSYTQEEQLGILLTSLGICVGIGLTDLIVQIIKRNHNKKMQALQNPDIIITNQTLIVPKTRASESNNNKTQKEDSTNNQEEKIEELSEFNLKEQ